MSTLDTSPWGRSTAGTAQPGTAAPGTVPADAVPTGAPAAAAPVEPSLPGQRRPAHGAGPARAATRGGRLYALDGLRLLAALSVLVFHYMARGGSASKAWGQQSRSVLPGIEPLADYGWLGVEFFFIISGFVICMSCWGRTPGQFFRSRLTRLYPAYWVAIGLIVVLQEIFPVVVTRRMSLHDILLNLTMLHEPLGVAHVDGVFWTLWVEMRFYLIFALVVRLGVTYRSTAVFCGLWTVGSVLTQVSHNVLLDNLLVPKYSAYFIAGIGFYLIHRFGHHALSWGIVGISWLIAQERVIAETDRFGKMINAPLSGTVGATVITVCFVVMAGVALGWFSRLNWRWLTTAGALTYPLYLTHEHLGHLVIYGLRDQFPPGVVLAVTTVAMLLLAWLVHRLAERPLARAMKRALEKPLPPSV
ncbi:acyltransferase family protein [Streptacidiphilus griseoplanus]|uniref:acyltransferase family protein n=1 Tax=Peterkaempfera griseoplana TaxID=66896 RepID=UPI000AF9DE19|nr:acyltransferase [Peterkaempfera griseoplana]